MQFQGRGRHVSSKHMPLENEEGLPSVRWSSGSILFYMLTSPVTFLHSFGFALSQLDI
jgi:hypothetical protein